MKKYKSAVFCCLIFFALIGLSELMAFAAYGVAFHEIFSYQKVAGLRYAALADPSIVKRPELHRVHGVIHPYFGYVASPESGANRYGFIGPYDHIQLRGPDKVVVAIVGGSVAAQLGVSPLEQALKRSSKFSNKNVVVLNLGLGAFKQPQSLFVVSDIISQGGHIDVLVAFDGFNEISVGEAHGNIHNGISPFYPAAWRQMIETDWTRQQAELFAKAQYTRDFRTWLVRIFSSTIPAHSITMNLLWRVLDNVLVRSEISLRSAALAERPIDSASRLTRDKRGFLGPTTEYSSRRQMYEDIAKHWARSSVLLNNMIHDQGGLYFHFLQPNQYVFASKLLSIEEERHAISKDSQYRLAVERGYPYLRVEGRRLVRAGLKFHDLVGIFKDRSDTLYIDTCCHLNESGIEIVVTEIARTITEDLQEGTSRSIDIRSARIDEGFELENLRTLSGDPEYVDGSEEQPARALPGARW